jgi:hypothetical protein
MAPLERLFALEVEFYHRLRTEAPGTVDAAAVHTSFAHQAGYEPLLRAAAGRVGAEDLARLAERHLAGGDPRDVLAARDSLIRWLDPRPFGR